LDLSRFATTNSLFGAFTLEKIQLKTR